MSPVIQGEVLKDARRSAALLDFPHDGVGICPLLDGVGVMDREPRTDTRQREGNRPADLAAGA